MNKYQILINTFLSSDKLANPLADIGIDNSLLEKAKRFVIFRDRVSDETEVSSIFSIIPEYNTQDFLPQRDLTIEEECFPNKANISTENSLDELVLDLISRHKEQSLADAIYYAFKQKAWSIKSEKGQGYLSEFEYLKSQTAFTTCLLSSKNEDYPFLLFCADISGIQDFIYAIHSKKASKSLKGRSFYLQLLIEEIIKQYIEKTETTICNVIYSSGGKFFMLLPNTDKIISLLDKMELELSTILYKEHQDTLSIMSAYIPFGITDRYGIISKEKSNEEEITNLKMLWKAVSQKTSKKKQQKLSLLFDSNFKLFFDGEMDKEFSDERYVPCAVTGQPTKRIKSNEIDEYDLSEEKAYVTPQVKMQVQLGEDLRDATYINEDEKGLKIFSQSKGFSIEAYKNNEKSIIINPIKATDGQAFLFYGGNRQALNDDKTIKTFEELSIPDEGKSFNKLGVLRMDVDDLGHLFTGKERSNETMTFATYSTLSAAMDWFFSGYLNSIRNSEKYDKYVNIIYAGGDDLFAVGRWDKLIDFAIEVRKKFREYTGGKDMLKLSGGLAIVNNKFPISKAANMAKSALDEAKKYQLIYKDNREYDKNAFHLFNQTVSWANGANDEMDFVIQLKELFSEHLKYGTLNRVYFYKLYQYQALKNKKDIKWYWQSAYHTGRYIERLKNEQQNSKELLKAIQSAIISKHFKYQNIEITANGHEVGRMLDLICLAAQLADYSNR